MKKLLSVIVTVAMLISCLAPALAVSAADATSAGLEVSVENVTFDLSSRDDVLTATATVSIVSNPGFLEGTLYLYATNTEMNITEVTDIQDLADGENGITIDVSLDKSTTSGSAVKKAFAAAGVETGATLRTAVIGMMSADEETDTTYTGDFLEVTFEIAKDKADIVDGEAYTFGLIAGAEGTCTNADGDDVATFAPLTGTVTAYTDPDAPVYADKQFENFTFFVDDVVVKPGVDTVTVGVGFDGTNEDFETYGLLSVEIGFVYPETFKIIECVAGTAMDPAATETAVQELTEGGNYYVADAPARLQDVFASSGYDSEGKTDKYVYQVHFSTGDDNPSYTGGYINYFTFDVSGAEPGTYELPLVTEGTVMGYDADADYKYIEWTSEYDLDNGHVTLTTDECAHESKTTKTVDATCTTDGSVIVTCDACGETISTSVIASEGHKPGEKYTVVEPTYESEGTWQIDCTVCYELLETGTIDALVPAASATVSLSDATVTLGEEIKLDLVIDGSDYFIAIVDVNYDEAELDFVEFANTLDAHVLVTEIDHGVVRLYIEAKADADLAAGVQGTLVFDAADYVTTYVTVDVVDLVGYEAGDIEYTATGATVKVVMPGNIVVGDAEAEYDSTVKVPVSVENSTGIWAGRIEIEYDTECLDLIDIESGLFAVVEGENYSLNGGVITIFLEAADMNDVTADGVLFTIEFETLSDVCWTSVEINIVELINVAGEDLDYGSVNGRVTITECQHKETTTDKVDATVDAAGYIRETCDKCGETVSETVLPALTAVYVTDYDSTYEEWNTGWVYIAIKNNPGIWAARLEITLDEGLAFEDLYGNLCSVNEGENYSVNGNVITVFLESETMENYTDDQPLVCVNVSADAVGTYGVSVEVLDLINVDGEDIEAVVTNGTVTFVECSHSGETYEEEIDATVDAEGSVTTYCSDCDKVISTVVIPKLAALVVTEETTEIWDTGCVGVNLVNNPGIWAARLEITFTEGADFRGLYGTDFALVEGENYSVDGNVITVFIENDEMVDYDGKYLFSVWFSSKEDTVAGDVIDVSVEVLDLINVDGNDIDPVVTNGKLTFVECTHALTSEEKVDATVDAEGYIKTICDNCGETLETVVLPKLTVVKLDAITEADVYTYHVIGVSVINNPGIWALRLEIAYDADAFDIGNFTSGAFNIDETNYSINEGVITVFIEYDAAEDYMEDDELFFVQFVPKKDAEIGNYPVTLTVVEAINYAGEDIAVEAVGTDFVVVEHTEHLSLGETVTENVNEADCKNYGSYDTVEYCIYCGTEMSRVTTTVPALGHTDGEPVIENEVVADCKNDGSYDTVVYCTVCGDEVSRETTVVPALGHTDGEPVVENEVAATCTTDGSYDTVVYCTVCGDEVSRVTTVVPALGHTDGEWVVIKEAHIGVEGLKVQYCSVCGEVIAEEIIPAITVPAIPGYFAESATIDGNEVKVIAKLDAPEVDFALHLPEGATVAADGADIVFDGNDYWFRSYPATGSYTVTVTETDGTVTVYTVTAVFSFSAYVPVIIPGWSVEGVEVDGDVINVTVLKDVTEVDFALDLPVGATAEAIGDVEAIFDGNDTWYSVKYGTESYTLVVTIADGTQYTFTVNVTFDVETYEAVATPGWSAESVVVDGNVINVTVIENVTVVDFALNIPDGATVVVTDGVECVFDGNDTWYSVSYGTGLDTYEITVTLANGTVYTYTVNVTFNVEAFDAEVMGGWSAANVAIDGNTVTLDVMEGVDVVDFAITNLPEDATVAVSENATIVFDGNDYWYSVERGTDTFEVVVTLASGVEYVYTVYVNFN